MLASRNTEHEQASRPSRFCAKALNHLKQVFWQHRGHWIVVLLLIALGTWLGHLFEENENLFGMRYAVFEFLEELSPRKPHARDTIVVLVDDAAYYKGEPAGRAPINRRYVARLVAILGDLNPAAIAIDFDLRAPDPTGRAKATAKDGTRLPEFPDYVDEATELLKTLRDVSLNHHIPIILPATITREGKGFAADSDIYDGFDFGSARVTRGFIAFDTDKKVIPPRKRLNNGAELDSFSLAAAKAKDANVLRDDQWGAKLFGGFLRGNGIPRLTAGAVLHAKDDDKLRAQVEHRIVLIGGAWHRLGYQRGPVIDSYETPVGTIPGALIHANYIEALLDRRVVLPLSGWLVTPAEWILALGLAYFLSIHGHPAIKASGVLILLAVPIFGSYVAVQNFGVYFDVLIVNSLLLVHVGVEKVIEWHRNHRKWLQHLQTKATGDSEE